MERLRRHRWQCHLALTRSSIDFHTSESSTRYNLMRMLLVTTYAQFCRNGSICGLTLRSTVGAVERPDHLHRDCRNARGCLPLWRKRKYEQLNRLYNTYLKQSFYANKLLLKLACSVEPTSITASHLLPCLFLRGTRLESNVE